MRDALGSLGVLAGRQLPEHISDAAEVLATVAGQDVEADDEGRFRIRRGVAKGRVISVVDPDARHGHKSSRGGFDGYKVHVAVDPDTELVTEVEVTAANVNDAGPVIDELLPEISDNEADEALVVVADSAYGSGPTRHALKEAGVSVIAKAPPEQNSQGGFPKSAFDIDIEANRATCPAGVTTTRLTQRSNGITWLRFPAKACNSCALKDRCTSSPNGRSITMGPHEALLTEARSFQRTDEFKAIYNSKRPTVERVIYRIVRNGGRKARYRGRVKISEQMRMKAAAENLARMLRCGLIWMADGGWAVT